MRCRSVGCPPTRPSCGSVRSKPGTHTKAQRHQGGREDALPFGAFLCAFVPWCEIHPALPLARGRRGAINRLNISCLRSYGRGGWRSLQADLRDSAPRHSRRRRQPFQLLRAGDAEKDYIHSHEPDPFPQVSASRPLCPCACDPLLEARAAGLFFTVIGSEARLSGASGVSGDIIIPGTYNGLPVTSIGNSAFSGCSGFMADALNSVPFGTVL